LDKAGQLHQLQVSETHFLRKHSAHSEHDVVHLLLREEIEVKL
jgi:hypothetical protein